MKEIRAVIRPEKLNDVLNSLREKGHPGITVTYVEGHGKQAGIVEQFRGREFRVELLPKVEIKIVCEDGEVEGLMKVIRDSSFTGEIGDGKIFIYDVNDVMRIRSGERGIKAI